MEILTDLQELLVDLKDKAFKVLEDNGVVWEIHSHYDNLYQFRYDPDKANFALKEVQESNGIILNKDRRWEIVAYPYDKIFNVSAPLAPKIDWTNSQVTDSLPDKFYVLYNYEGWRVATNQHICDESEADLFWEAWMFCRYDLPYNASCSYIYTLIKEKEDYVIYLHGVRNNNSGIELDHTGIGDRYRWNSAKIHNLVSLSDTTTFVSGKQRGVIVRDAKFNRIEIKV